MKQKIFFFVDSRHTPEIVPKFPILGGTNFFLMDDFFWAKIAIFFTIYLKGEGISLFLESATVPDAF